MISRRQVAQYLVALDIQERPAAIRQAAAWLVASRRGHEVGYLVLDVAAGLQCHGTVWARATTAHELPAATRASVERYLKHSTSADHVQLELEIDPSLIGGIKLTTATSAMDVSLKAQLGHLSGARQ